jgi:hypothetical protein
MASRCNGAGGGTERRRGVPCMAGARRATGQARGAMAFEAPQGSAPLKRAAGARQEACVHESGARAQTGAHEKGRTVGAPPKGASAGAHEWARQ